MDTSRTSYFVEYDGLFVGSFFEHSRHPTLKEAITQARRLSEENHNCPARVMEVTATEVWKVS